MALETVALMPRIGTEIKADAATLLSEDHAAEIREPLQQRGGLIVRGLPLEDGRMMHRTTIEAIEELVGA